LVPCWYSVRALSWPRLSIPCSKLTAILGLSAYYHDSAAALIDDGMIVAAAQEERFSRKKHDARFPKHAIAYILRETGLTLGEIDYIAFYDKPFLKFERLLETYLAFAPRGFQSFRHAMPVWIQDKLFQKNQLMRELREIDNSFTDTEKLLFSEHHFSHAASAFYPSPFEQAVVLTMDGVGEWTTTSIAIGQGHELKIEKEIHFPHSIGLLYSAFTYYIGFKVNSGEYKLMGLAPYGTPRYKDTILEHLIDIKEDGSFRLDQSYFNYCTGLTMISKKFTDLFGQPTRHHESGELTRFHMDIAASIQSVTDEIVLKITRHMAQEYAISNLCLAGGVALNCVTNGKVLRDSAFKNIWIQPAAGDAGGSIGAALAVWHTELKQERKINQHDSMRGAYLGPEYLQTDINTRLTSLGAVYKTVSQSDLLNLTAQAIAYGMVTGWFQGRLEFGPRALGSRSILGDPRSETMQKTLNLKIKFRESFRPFAPSVLEEELPEWFELDHNSPYMLLVADVCKSRRRAMTLAEESLFGIDKLNIKRSDIPAVTHVDYSARIQTVHKETNPLFHDLISHFRDLTGCPVLINTSFNVRGEPIVCTPEDAFRCFMRTEMDLLVIGNSMLWKSKQVKQSDDKSWQDEFEPD
jgi:carbamoyltransferase